MFTPLRAWALPALALLLAAPVAAQPADAPAPQTYRLPPPHILDIMDAPAAPYARITPNQKWLLITERDLDWTPLAELAEPQGSRQFKLLVDRAPGSLPRREHRSAPITAVLSLCRALPRRDRPLSSDLEGILQLATDVRGW